MDGRTLGIFVAAIALLVAWGPASASPATPGEDVSAQATTTEDCTRSDPVCQGPCPNGPGWTFYIFGTPLKGVCFI